MYTPKIVADRLGMTPDLLKVWSNEFNIQTERSPGGHRRYSKENIEELTAIKEKYKYKSGLMIRFEHGGMGNLIHLFQKKKNRN